MLTQRLSGVRPADRLSLERGRCAVRVVAKLAEAEQLLLEQLAPNVQVFESYPGGGAMAEGSNALLQAWNGDARQGVLAEGDTGRWKWVLPSERSPALHEDAPARWMTGYWRVGRSSSEERINQ